MAQGKPGRPSRKLTCSVITEASGRAPSPGSTEWRLGGASGLARSRAERHFRVKRGDRRSRVKVSADGANAGSNTAADHVTVLDMALASLPAHARPRPGDPGSPRVLARSDSTGATHVFAAACRKRMRSETFFTTAVAHLGASAAGTLMVGDDIEPDVLAAQRQGLTGALDVFASVRRKAATRNRSGMQRARRRERLLDGHPARLPSARRQPMPQARRRLRRRGGARGCRRRCEPASGHPNPGTR